jgi:hypothetical protein
MIKYSDSARSYIERTRRANHYLANNAIERHANRKARRINAMLTLSLVAVVLGFIAYLPHALDANWEQQYERPAKYIQYDKE